MRQRTAPRSCLRFLHRAKFLPWEVFRRIASESGADGLRTSHFAWFEHAQTIHDEYRAIKWRAANRSISKIYTPVCLHMGAAVACSRGPIARRFS
jgi:hypothetical protein